MDKNFDYAAEQKEEEERQLWEMFAEHILDQQAEEHEYNEFFNNPRY